MIPRRFLLSGLALLLCAAAAPVLAQGAECDGLRAEIDAFGRTGGTGRFDMALTRQRDELERTRAYAGDSGCAGDAPFDEPDAPQCRALARRVAQLQSGLQHLQDQAAQGDPEADDRRRALVERFNAACGDGAETLPVDPDASPAPAAPAPAARIARVLCVRQCDGAWYPLAADVAAERMGDMDRVCQAQCPAAASNAYAAGEGEDVTRAVTGDGTPYTALPTAFRFRTATVPTCACRAPHQSWAEALAGSEALLEPHKGDVTVTAALAAAMSRPAVSPRPDAPRTQPVKKPSGKVPPPLVVPAPGGVPDLDLTRAFRGTGPRP